MRREYRGEFLKKKLWNLAEGRYQGLVVSYSGGAFIVIVLHAEVIDHERFYNRDVTFVSWPVDLSNRSTARSGSEECGAMRCAAMRCDAVRLNADRQLVAKRFDEAAEKGSNAGGAPN
jgi:hypothetical protein